MENPQTPAKASAKPAKRTYKRRVSAKVRHALTIRVKEGKTWIDAARAAGLSEAGIHKARKQQHVQEEYERIKQDYVAQIEKLEAVHKARALEVARELLDQTENKQIRARMVEFLRREQPQAGPIVQINQQFNGGYEFVPRGAKVVDIQRSTDDTSADAEEITEQDQ